jgi:transcriptional regulator with XRE-family HTH domain
LRETATVIGIAPATLLRVEGGRIPDVVTFGKICKWLGVDPAMFLGTDATSKRESSRERLEVSAHLKADQTPQRKTINALAEMILLAANSQGEDQGR